ncbi:hypothetical protein ACVWYF_004059 [Hymenobacter sp. UYAg731]
MMLRLGLAGERFLRVLAIVETVFFPNESGFSVHAAIGAHRAGALGPFVFAQHFGTYFSFLSQHFAAILGGFASLLRVGGKADTCQAQQASYNESRKMAHQKQAEK